MPCNCFHRNDKGCTEIRYMLKKSSLDILRQRQIFANYNNNNTNTIQKSCVSWIFRTTSSSLNVSVFDHWQIVGIEWKIIKCRKMSRCVCNQMETSLYAIQIAKVTKKSGILLVKFGCRNVCVCVGLCAECFSFARIPTESFVISWHLSSAKCMSNVYHVIHSNFIIHITVFGDYVKRCSHVLCLYNILYYI